MDPFAPIKRYLVAQLSERCLFASAPLSREDSGGSYRVDTLAMGMLGKG